MKIAMMGAWNTDSGASIHAELIGRSWIEKGIDLKNRTSLMLPGALRRMGSQIPKWRPLRSLKPILTYLLSRI